MADERDRQQRRGEPAEGSGVLGFLFGVALGAVAGFAAMVFAGIGDQLWFSAACGLIVGAIGYFYGDRFWFWLTDRLHWFQ